MSVVELEVWSKQAREDFAALVADAGPDGYYVTDGARVMVERIRRRAPVRSGRLRDSFRADRERVLSSAPYARVASVGGLVRPTNRNVLLVPFASGYSPRSGGNVTVHKMGAAGTVGYVFRRGSLYGLEAIRRSFVIIRGSRYLSVAEDEEAAEAAARIGADVLNAPPGAGKRKGGKRG